MVKSRLYIAAVASVMVLGGCHGDAPPATSNAMGRLPTPTTAPAVQSIATTSDLNATNEVPMSADGAAALAQRAATYAKAVTPNLALPPTTPGVRMQNPTAPAHPKSFDGQPIAEASAETKDFPDPDSMHLTVANPPALADASMVTHHELVQAQGGPLQDRRAPVAAAQPPDSADVLSSTLTHRAHDYPRELSPQVDDQLLRLVKDEQVPDPNAMAQLPPEDREVLGALLDGLTNFRNGLRQNNNMLLSQKVLPLIDMSERLRAQAELNIPTATFTTTPVSGYGNYIPMKPARFIAGRRQAGHLYFEIENFASQLNASQLYETRLRVTRVLYMESTGMPVLNDPPVNVTDTCFRRRHDYYLHGDFVLPANLTIGRYLLKVTVEDMQARRIAENTIPVEIVASLSQ